MPDFAWIILKYVGYSFLNFVFRHCLVSVYDHYSVSELNLWNYWFKTSSSVQAQNLELELKLNVLIYCHIKFSY